MSYCVHCGVELENGTPACPLCRTPVIDPSAADAPKPPPLYPPTEPIGIPRVSRRVVLLLCVILHLIPALITLVCDWSLSGTVTWSAYVLGAVTTLIGTIALLLYAKILPAFGKILAIGALWTGYTFFVEYWISGKLKIPFALPLVVYGTLMLAVLFLIGRLTKKSPRPFFLTALFLLMAGGFCVLIELWINYRLSITPRAFWSIYPAGTGFLLFCLFSVIDRSRTLKAKLKKKLFI